MPVLRVQLDRIVAPVSPVFSGMMTEEINHSYDGGLYGELLQNRVFKDDAQNAVHWSLVQSPGSEAQMALDPVQGLNAELATSLRLEVAQASDANLVGVANDGYWGIPVIPATDYRASFYAKAAPGYTGSVRVAIQSADGTAVYASADAGPVRGEWQKYSVTLTTPANRAPTAGARFVLLLDRPGTVWFDLVSFFPPTWKDLPAFSRR
jgi:alpha-N-arabinofuranosidase